MNIVILFCCIFALQSALSIIQLRYYQKHMDKLVSRYSRPETAKHRLYSAMEKKKFAFSGAIALIIIDDDARVKECQILQGKSVFAKFKEIPQFKNRTLEQIACQLNSAQSERKLFLWEKAIIKTMNQISRA